MDQRSWLWTWKRRQPASSRLFDPDQTTEILDLDDLEIRLAQPAFGIDESGTDAKGFPLGALVFEGEFDLGAAHYTVRGPNTDVVLVSADQTFSPSFVSALGSSTTSEVGRPIIRVVAGAPSRDRESGGGAHRSAPWTAMGVG